MKRPEFKILIQELDDGKYSITYGFAWDENTVIRENKESAYAFCEEVVKSVPDEMSESDVQDK